MIDARSTAAQCAAMVAAVLLSLRPLLLGYEVSGAASAISWFAGAAALVAALLAVRAARGVGAAEPAARSLVSPAAAQGEASLAASLAALNSPFAGRRARRLSFAARALAAAGFLASLAARVHESQLTSTPALFWLSALAATALAAWACVHLRASLVRARFFWALALGMLIAVLSALERPDAFTQPATGLSRLEPGSGVNLILGVSALLIGEGHPGAELFAMVPLYSPSSSAVEPRVPWFRHLAAVVAALAVGLALFGLRSSNVGPRALALGSALFAALALALLALPVIAMPAFFDSLDGVALWLLSGAAAIFAPPRESKPHEGPFA